MWVRAFDGFGWGEWDAFTLTSQNIAPVVSVGDQTAHTNEWISLQNRVTTSDADSDAITQYQFYDAGSAPGSGYIWTADIGQQAANTYITVAATDLGTTWLRSAQTPGSELMWVRVFDGTEWSAWDAFTLTSSERRAGGRHQRSELANQPMDHAAGPFTASDADGDVSPSISSTMPARRRAAATSGPPTSASARRTLTSQSALPTLAPPGCAAGR